MPTASIISPLPKMPKLQSAWRWFNSISWGVAGLALSICAVVFGVASNNHASSLIVIPAIMFAAMSALLGRWYADRLYARYYGEHHVGYGIMLRSGVWWHKEIWVPLVRLQHIDVDQGPLDRSWGMATLTLYTAGTHENEIKLRGLPVLDAHALRQALLPTERSPHE